MKEKITRRKWSASSYTVYGVSQVEGNSRNETVKRTILQDRPDSGRVGDLNVGVDVFPKRRDHAQHPDRRCEQESDKDACCAQPDQARFHARQASKTLKRSEPHRLE